MTNLLLAALLAAPSLGGRLDVGLALPLSQPQTFYFSAGPQVSGTAMLGVLPFLDVEVQLGWLLLDRTPSSPTAGPGTLLSLGAGARLKLPHSERLLVPWAEFLLNYGFSGGSRFPITATAGVSLHPGKLGFLVGAFFRLHHIVPAQEASTSLQVSPATLLSVGLSVEFMTVTREDKDGDGVADTSDACPADKGSAPNGCPEASEPTDDADGDGDGVPDAQDTCATKPEDKDGVKDDDGCPELDGDADGIDDVDDRCPTQPGTLAGKGCPGASNDKDKDGVPDDQDRCPDVAGGKDQGGCPKYRELTVTEVKIEIKEKIFFAFGKTSLLPKSEPLLDEVAQALLDRGLCVRVEGHTDNRGAKEANLTLSQGRAEAVRDYLVQKGVPPEHVTPKGYGDQLPVDDNATLEGRENNRRVEFILIPCAP